MEPTFHQPSSQAGRSFNAWRYSRNASSRPLASRATSASRTSSSNGTVGPAAGRGGASGGAIKSPRTGTRVNMSTGLLLFRGRF